MDLLLLKQSLNVPKRFDCLSPVTFKQKIILKLAAQSQDFYKFAKYLKKQFL